MFESIGCRAGQFSDFLADKHNLSASTVKGYRSAISTTSQQCGGLDLSDTNLLHHVAHGLSQHEAWQLRRTPSWDLFVVLAALRHPLFEHLHSVSVRFFAMKTTFPLSLVSRWQRSEVHAVGGAKHDITILKD